MTRKLYMVAALAAMGLFIYSSNALAGAGECSGGACGTPKESGGGGCGCGGGSILINNTDLGDTYQYADDYDEDGWEDDTDNCPFVKNKAQTDGDGDKIGDACDLCKNTPDVDQLDTDGDGLGDKCDPDIDNDSIVNSKDLCPLVADVVNGKQIDTDNDGKGDACDLDDDNDGYNDTVDNCPLVANPDQLNSDPNSYGDACDRDQDKDNIEDSKDNCVLVPNPNQQDSDGDKLGDMCDMDKDNDGVANLVDNCAEVPNKTQIDADRDGRGDACDARYCFTVKGDEKNCLDPASTFRVYSPEERVQTGEQIRLRLFANRRNTPIRYRWIVKRSPSGSTATVVNPMGTVRMSTPFEYHYIKGNVATITVDEPGEYQIKLQAELVFPDPVNANFPRQHGYVMTLVAEGDSMGGCSVGGTPARGGAAGAATVLVLLGLVLGLRRRR